MGFYERQKTKNLMPSSASSSISNNGITFISNGDGTYRVYGTSTDLASATFNLSESFVIPVSVTQGGTGTFSLFNLAANRNTFVDLYNGDVLIDDWAMSVIERKSNSYSTMSGKTCNRIVIKVTEGQTIDISFSPMFTNDSEYPVNFEKYGSEWKSLSPHIMSTTWQDGSTYERDSGTWT